MSCDVVGSVSLIGRRGFQFVAMVVGQSSLISLSIISSVGFGIWTIRGDLSSRPGESGLGKSTLINTLFETKLYQPKDIPPPGADRGRTVQIESISAGGFP